MNITFEAVREIICRELGVDEQEATPGAQIVDDLGADSLDHVELVMAIEEAYGIVVSDEDMEKIRTVQDIVDYLQAHVKGAA
jgi:acyl carrier protein